VVDDTSKDYPDLEPDGLGDLKSIKRVNGMAAAANVPQISWGPDYMSWPLKRRLRFAERLASSMNHAADLLQKERNALLDIKAKLERQLKHSEKKYLEQGELFHSEVTRAGEREQAALRDLVETKRSLKEALARLKALEVDDGC
jgi:Skp family chaperone for outer membrane proteins